MLPLVKFPLLVDEIKPCAYPLSKQRRICCRKVKNVIAKGVGHNFINSRKWK
uniref:Uncharacterized protein n=1 Tax=Rhizophora mucronata TaxID=61149 RepID=A0A2P2JRN4_RHIMU